MPLVMETPHIERKLRALDPDLPMLAAQAAMELDNCLSSGERNFGAVRQLSVRLKNSFSLGGSSVPKSLLDSGTISLIGQALHTSRWVGQFSTLDQLSTHLLDVADRLSKVEDNPKAQPVERVRDFCVALSECAASYRQALHDLQPSHPFKK